MRSFRSSWTRLVVTVVGLGVVVSACGDGPTSTPPSTTTTTLPVASSIDGTAPAGDFSGLGAVNRVEVARVVPGHIEPRLAPDGTLGASAIEIGFRQFGAGPDLVLVTGQHGSMTSWDARVLVDLAAHFRVTVFDFPGIGYSAPDARYRSVGSLADLTAGLIWVLGLQRPTVLGWGLGGSVAISLVERHPGVVSRLALADSTAGGKSAVAPSTAIAASLKSPLATPTELSRLYFPPTADVQRTRWLADFEAVPPDSITSGAIVRQGELATSLYRSNAVVDALRRVRVPTLIFAGTNDVVVPAENARILDHSITGARLVELQGAGYAAIFQFASAFVTDLVDFAAK